MSVNPIDVPNKKVGLLQWLRSLLFLLLVVATVVLWHPLLLLSWLISERAAFWVLGLGVSLMIQWLRVVRIQVKITGLESLPPHGPFVVIANHQSLFDIPLLQYALRSFGPRFVAKKELGKWFPSVSMVLRRGGSALIDRGDSSQALNEIERLGRQVKERKHVACIFPEGTRARDGKLKKFKSAGVSLLVEEAGNCPLVTAVISQSWRMMQHNFWPVPGGYEISLEFSRLALQGDRTVAEQAFEAIQARKPH